MASLDYAYRRLVNTLGPERVSRSEFERMVYSHDFASLPKLAGRCGARSRGRSAFRQLGARPHRARDAARIGLGTPADPDHPLPSAEGLRLFFRCWKRVRSLGLEKGS